MALVKTLSALRITGVTLHWFSGRRRRCVNRLAAILLMSFLSSFVRAASPFFPGATPDYKAWIEVRLPGNPEGLAQDAQGRLYASIAHTGQIVRLDGKGGYETVAIVPSPALGPAGMTAGMEFDKAGQLYVAYMWSYTPDEESDPLHPACRNSNDRYTGIYKVDPATRSVTAFVTKKDGWPACFPDDIAIDSKSNLYISDLTLSGIWKISPDGKYTLWCSDPKLQWSSPPYYAYPEGANDLVITKDEKALYVVTDGNPGIVRVPINADGSAGAPEWVVKNLTVTDGVELDELGNIYVSEIERDEISVFSPDGHTRIVVATADTAPIANPTSLVYRDGVLCVANLGAGPQGLRQPRSVTCISGFKRPRS
jgi:sugar lactone lactonase YvrE